MIALFLALTLTWTEDVRWTLVGAFVLATGCLFVWGMNRNKRWAAVVVYALLVVAVAMLCFIIGQIIRVIVVEFR